jgi:thiosulfate reductase cytochrome b subunit
MKVHCDRNGLNIEFMRFLFDGIRIKDNDTPDSVSLKEYQNTLKRILYLLQMYLFFLTLK